WLRSSASTSRGTKSLLLTSRRSSTPSISHWCLSGKHRNHQPRTLLFRYGNLFARHTSCASNAERARRFYAGTSGRLMAWKLMSIEPSGLFRRITQSALLVIQKSDPPSQSRLAWDRAQHHAGESSSRDLLRDRHPLETAP